MSRSSVLNLRKRKLQLEADIADLTDQASARDVMEKLIPWVGPQGAAQSLPEVEGDAQVSSAGIWSSEECEASLNASSIYEASGLALWLQTGALMGPAAMATSTGRALKDSKRSSSQRGWPFRLQSPGCKAPQKQKSERQRILWPATMICGDKSLARNLQSEEVKALGHASLSNSFLTFAGLVKVLAIEKVQDGAAAGLAYNGTVYNAAIHKAALSLAGVLEDPGRHVEQSLSGLQYGRDILSSEYSKLSKLLAYGKSLSPSWSMVQGPRSNGEISGWMIDMLVLAFKTKLRLPSKATEGWLDKDRKTGMIDMLVLAFKTKLRLPSKATEGWLDKDRKTGTPGYWQVSWVFEYAEKLVTKLPEPEIQKAKAVLEDLLSPLRCWEKFLEPDEKSLVDTGFLHEDDLEEEGACAVVVPSGPLPAMKENFTKATGQLFDLLLEVISGKHFSDCQELASQAGGLIKALQDTENDLEFLKQLRLVTELIDGGQSKSVTASAAAPAPSLLTQLTATGQVNAEADAERERHWKTVQSERRKFASFGVPKNWTKESLLSSFRACGKILYVGQLNTGHRLLCASADLMHEQGDEPWAMPSVPPAPVWKEVVAFMNGSATGPADFLMAFDGRSMKPDDSMLLGQIGFGRLQRTFVLGESKPIALRCAILDEWNVQAVLDCTPGSGALMEAALTRGILYHGLCVELCCGFSGRPKHTQTETSMVSDNACFGMLQCLNSRNHIAACFCMPGACKSQGQNKEHLQWLQTIAEGAACGLIALEGSSMFSEENAAAVKKCFPDVLAGLAKAKEEEDADLLEPESPNE
eukprot:s3826_g3.t1